MTDQYQPGRAFDGATIDPSKIVPVQPGNLDPWNRPVWQHPTDNGYGTTNSISIGTDQGETLIPTIINGFQFSNEDAIQHYQNTGEHLGVFRSPGEADAFAQWLHEEQARRIEAAPGGWKGVKARGGRLQ